MARERIHRYVEIEAELRILLADARPGDPLPSETELSLRFGVSRMTARQAVQSLENEGLVYRIIGSGTFASGRGAHRTMGVLRSFTEDMNDRGIEVTSKVLHAEWVEPDRNTRAALTISAGSRAIRIVRVRLGNGVPMALETVALTPRCSFVLDYDLAIHSLHQLLKEKGIIPTEAQGTLVASAANEKDAATLSIPIGSPLLVETREIDDQTGTRIESTETKYVGDRYIFDIHLRRLEENTSNYHLPIQASGASGSSITI